MQPEHLILFNIILIPAFIVTMIIMRSNHKKQIELYKERLEAKDLHIEELKQLFIKIQEDLKVAEIQMKNPKAISVCVDRTNIH